MRRYECVVILDPDLPDDDLKSATEKYGDLIKNTGGEIIKIEPWGSRKLAYLVKKKDRGHYVLFDFVGTPALISELERQLKIADEVLKFMSIKLDDHVDLEAFKEANEAKTVESQATESAEAPAAEATDLPESAENAAESTEAPAEPQKTNGEE